MEYKGFLLILINDASEYIFLKGLGIFVIQRSHNKIARLTRAMTYTFDPLMNRGSFCVACSFVIFRFTFLILL